MRVVLTVFLLGLSGCYMNVGEAVPDAAPSDPGEADAGIDAPLGPPVTLHVAAAADDEIADGSPEHPYARIQDAVAAAKSGDTIAVAAGTYFENVVVEGKAVALVGADAVIKARDESAAVAFLEAAGARIEGFRITGGRGWFDGDRWEGGGIYALGGALTVARCVIEENDIRHGPPDQTLTRGGGIAISGGEATIVGNVIRANRAGRGAGIAAAGPKIVIRDNLIEANRGDHDHGGGVFLSSPDAVVERNRILDNEIGRELGYGWGGGVYLHDRDTAVRFEGNLIRGNHAPTIGAGIFVDNEALAFLSHDLIVANACPERGGAAVYVDGLDDTGVTGSAVNLDHVTIASHPCAGAVDGGNAVYVEGDSRAVITNSLFWDNGGDDVFVAPGSLLSARYTLSEEPIEGEGNLSADPCFADPAAGDYHVMSRRGRWDPGTGAWVADGEHSPAIDAADPEAPWDRELAPNGGRANLGADGNRLEASLSLNETAPE